MGSCVHEAIDEMIKNRVVKKKEKFAIILPEMLQELQELQETTKESALSKFEAIVESNKTHAYRFGSPKKTKPIQEWYELHTDNDPSPEALVEFDKKVKGKYRLSNINLFFLLISPSPIIVLPPH